MLITSHKMGNRRESRGNKLLKVCNVGGNVGDGDGAGARAESGEPGIWPCDV